MENYSRIWGGAGNILIPCNEDGRFSHVFGRILRVFDPDLVATYWMSGTDVKLADRSTFDRRFKERQEQLMNQGMTAKDALRFTTEEAEATDGWEPNRAVTESIIRCCAPFLCGSNLLFHAHFSADSNVSWGLTDAALIERAGDNLYWQVDVSTLDDLTRLMVASRVGGIAPAFGEALSHAHRIHACSLPEDDLPKLWRSCWLRSRIQPKNASPCWSWDYTPLGRTTTGCGEFIDRHAFFQRRRPFYLVLGDAPEDYCLWLALDRLTDSAIWVPSSFVADSTDDSTGFQKALRAFLQRGVADPGTQVTSIVTSVHAGEDRLRCAVDWLKRHVVSARQLDAKVVPPDQLDLTVRFRFLEKEAVDVLSNGAFLGDLIAFPLNTPIPRAIRTNPEGALHWVVDVAVDGGTPPPRGMLASALRASDTGNEPTLRCSSAGITYSAQSPIQIGAGLQHNIIRPVFRVPNAHTVFTRLLNSAGCDAELSDKGRYTRAALTLWGGLDALHSDLSDKRRLKILLSFLQGIESNSARGLFLKDAQRRYLSFVDLVLESGISATECRELLDVYLERGILARGIILKCSVCKLTSWHALETVSRSFTCGRCRGECVLTRQVWIGQHEPRWYYELVEVVYQALRYDMLYPIATLHALRRETRTFQFVPELAVSKNGAQVAEVDICAILDSEILVGEAKKGGALGNSAKEEKRTCSKLRRVAHAVTADSLVFATGANEWRAATKKHMLSALAGSGLRLWFLEGVGGSGKPRSTSQWT